MTDSPTDAPDFNRDDDLPDDTFIVEGKVTFATEDDPKVFSSEMMYRTRVYWPNDWWRLPKLARAAAEYLPVVGPWILERNEERFHRTIRPYIRIRIYEHSFADMIFSGLTIVVRNDDGREDVISRTRPVGSLPTYVHTAITGSDA